jgi:hypothetical protein
MDFAAWKEQAEPDVRTVSVCFNRRLYADYEQAKEALERLPADADDDLRAGALRTVSELAAQVDADEQEHTFTFVCLPYGQWRTLVESHAPSKEQERNGWEWNPETFGPSAVAAACQTPVLEQADAEWLREFLPRGEWHRLSEAALQVNVGGSSIPLSERVIAARLGSELNSIMQRNEESA